MRDDKYIRLLTLVKAPTFLHNYSYVVKPYRYIQFVSWRLGGNAIRISIPFDS